MTFFVDFYGAGSGSTVTPPPPVPTVWRVTDGRIYPPNSTTEFIAAGMNGGVTINTGPTVGFGGGANDAVAWAWDGYSGDFQNWADVWPGDTNVSASVEKFPGGPITAASLYDRTVFNFTQVPDRTYATIGTRSTAAVNAGIAAPADHWHNRLWRIPALTRITYSAGGALITWNGADILPSRTIPQYVARCQELVALGMVVSIQDHQFTARNPTIDPAMVANPMADLTTVYGAEFTGAGADANYTVHRQRDSFALYDAICAAFPGATSNLWIGLPNEAFTTTRSTAYDDFVFTYVSRIRGKGFEGIISIPTGRWAGDLAPLAAGDYASLITRLANAGLDDNLTWEWHNYGLHWNPAGVNSIATYAQVKAALDTLRTNKISLWMSEYGQAVKIGGSATGNDNADRAGVEIIASNTQGTAIGTTHPWIRPTWWATADGPFDRAYSLTYGDANKGNPSGPQPHTEAPNLGTYPWWDVTTAALRDEWLSPGGRAHWDLSHTIWQG